jgi:serine/threonine-protein kinase
MMATTSERWRRVQALCEALEEVPSAEQETRARGLEPDENLRTEAIALLQAMRDEAAYRENDRRAASAPELHPTTVGGVRILERLGSGGSGDVFRGVRTINGTEQFVAVKRFHAHRASAEHLERFAREQRMLATLTHPGIVRFIDAGVTEDGRPFLVMELAEGHPITTDSDERRLRLDDRLELFLSVCDAVQSAHRHLIVHLDLKPSNILVTPEGHVKLLDFGTAKLADPSAGFTRTEPLTLQYASPERLRGEAVSVACDVYSLGLILFELASGAWPFRWQESLLSVAERASGNIDTLSLSKVVTEEAADRRATTLSRLRAAVHGDLEAITSKALAHEPGARYASVADLAEDVRRFMAREPVRAQVPGVGYVFRKFVRRHAWEVVGVATLIVGLAGAAAYSAGQAQNARQAADRAQTQNRFLTSLFTLAGTDSSSTHDMTVRELLALAEERIQPSLGSTPTVAADVEGVLANGYISQGAFPQARILLARAIERARAIGDAAREANATANLAYVAYAQNQTAEASERARSALAQWKQHQDRFTPSQAVSTLSAAASTLQYVDTTDPVQREFFESCITIARAFAADLEPFHRANCLRGLAVVYMNLDSRYGESAALLQEVIELQRADQRSATGLGLTLQLLGLVRRYQGHFADDERAQWESYEIVSRLQGPESVAALWQRAVWVTSLLGVGRAEEAYRESLGVLAAARKVYSTPGSYLLWTPLFTASAAACFTARHDECEALSGEAIKTLGPHPAANDPRLLTARGLLGVALAHRGRHAEAKAYLEGALAMNASRNRTSPFTSLFKDALTLSTSAR